MSKSKLNFKTKCWLRRDIVSRCADQHRIKTTDIQNKLASNDQIGLKKFHKLFNRYEIRHQFLIEKINYNEKKRYQ